MLSIFRVLMVLAAVVLPRLAFAQGAVQQAPGSVTQYDFACWYANGLVFDCGISSLSPVALPATPTGNLLGNATGSTTAAQVTPLTSLIDSICPGVAQGNLLIRDVAGWDCLGTGTNGFFLESQGFAANPTWANPTGTTYTAGTGLTLSGTAFSLTNPVAVGLGGTGLASGTSGGVLAYTGTTTLASSALLAQHGVMLGGGAGAVPYALSSLGTSGQVLTSNGASADPSWGSAGGSGTVTSIATNNGITGGTITTTGTIGCVSATSSTEGCVTPDGTSTHFLNGAGNWVAATNANYVSLSTVAQVFTGGIYPTAFSNGTGSSGTKTIDCGNGPIQSLTNGGNFTLAMAPQDGSCVLRVTNNGSAGTITFSGFSEGTNTGDSLTTTNGNIFDISLTRIGGNPHRLVSALQ